MYVANVNVPQITQENIVNVITKDVVMKMVYCVQEMVYVIVLYVCVTKVTTVPDVNVPRLQICVVMIMVLCVQVMVSVSVASVNVLLIIGERSVNNVQHVQESVKPIKIVLNVWGSSTSACSTCIHFSAHSASAYFPFLNPTHSAQS